jgi:hypothetical protein
VLNTLGMARMSFGDFAGMDDLEESVRLALEHGSPMEIARTYNNLGVMCMIAGRVERAWEVFSARLELDERFGMPRSFGQAVMAQRAYWTGRWNEAARLVDAVVGESPPGGWEPLLHVRAVIRLARDDLVGAADDCARALDGMGGEWGGAGSAVEGLCACARVSLATGRVAESAELVETALAEAWAPPYGYAGVVELAFLLPMLDRSVDPVVQAAQAHPRHPWLKAAAAFARGDLRSAADQLAELHSPPLESYARLRAAERLLAEGGRGEADVQLQRALAFYRSVGATRYIREGEALLAAAG